MILKEKLEYIFSRRISRNIYIPAFHEKSRNNIILSHSRLLCLKFGLIQWKTDFE